MIDWVASGRALDVILVLVALEAVAIVVWHARTGRGLAPADALGFFAAGALLIAAVRCALVGAVGWTAVFLSAAGPVHVFDLWRRTRRG